MKIILFFLLACLNCHRGIEKISDNHNFTCSTCHNGNPAAETVSLAHSGLIRNPSAPAYVDDKCGRCHKKEIENVRKSLHSTQAKVIAVTRFLFGAQKTPDFIYGASDKGGFKLLPEPPPHPETPSEIVDDLLRRKCLRCHINTEGIRSQGFYRASGCAACHVVYDNDGIYKGNDMSLRHKRGYPAFHRFVKNIPDVQCMHCHNGNRVGADYHGYFEHDYDRAFRSPYPEKIIYGIDFHYLKKDLHAERGLTCIDCHRGIMNDESVTCESCHGGFNTHPDSRFVNQNVMLTVSGEKLKVPAFRKDIDGHDENHRNVECSLCHASWAYGDYGLHLVRIDIPDYYPWRRLILQGDPIVTEFLSKQLSKPFEKWDMPVMKDFIDGSLKRGLWLMGWSLRRWEIIPMGVNKNGKFSAYRPMYQIFVSYVDSEGYVIMDSEIPIRGDGKVWGSVPFTPHTTGRGRACFSCHGSAESLGLGYRLYIRGKPEVVVDSLTILPPAIFPDSRLLNREEIEKLLKPRSNVYFQD